MSNAPGSILDSCEQHIDLWRKQPQGTRRNIHNKQTNKQTTTIAYTAESEVKFVNVPAGKTLSDGFLNELLG